VTALITVDVLSPIVRRGERYKIGTKAEITLDEAEKFGPNIVRIVKDATYYDANWQRMRDEHGVRPSEMPRTERVPRVPKTRVGWIQDTRLYVARGAEASNAEVVRVGRLLGFDVELLLPGAVKGRGDRFDLLVVNNLRRFSVEETRTIAHWCFEDRIPFIRYEHDFGFCRRRNQITCAGDLSTCAGCSEHTDETYPAARFYRAQFAQAALSVFISPLQRAIIERAIGKVPGAVYELTPPVSTETFRPVAGIKREADLVVCTAGQLPAHKGRDAVIAWAREHPEMRVVCYAIRDGKVDQDAKRAADVLENLSIVPVVPHDELVRVYSRAAKLLFLPAGPEPAGRTPVEAALCGCMPILNENVGCAGFNLPWGDRDALATRLEDGVVGFWRAVEATCST